MFFQIIHTHTHETCPALLPPRAARFNDWWESFKKAEGVKIHSGVVSPLSHTFYFLVEADDATKLSAALAYLNSIGSGQVVQVVPFDKAVDDLVGPGVYFLKE